MEKIALLELNFGESLYSEFGGRRSWEDCLRSVLRKIGRSRVSSLNIDTSFVAVKFSPFKSRRFFVSKVS